MRKNMGYNELYCVIDGDTEASVEFPHTAIGWYDRTHWVNTQKRFAYDNRDLDVAIYEISHDHGSEVKDCVCVQYLTDHHPLWSQVGAR